MTEFSNVDRKGGEVLPTNPRRHRIDRPVRDLDVVYAAAKKAGAPISCRAPVRRSVLRRTAERPARSCFAIPTAISFALFSVQPLYQVGQLGGVDGRRGQGPGGDGESYHDALGMDSAGDLTFTRDSATSDLSAPRPRASTVRCRCRFQAPTTRGWNSTNWKGMARTPFHLRVPDPGAGGWVCSRL